MINFVKNNIICWKLCYQLKVVPCHTMMKYFNTMLFASFPQLQSKPCHEKYPHAVQRYLLLQLIGTAIGTSVAVIFDNLYYGWQERTCILPHYNTCENPSLINYWRFINDTFGIWIGTGEKFENLMKVLTLLTS